MFLIRIIKLILFLTVLICVSICSYAQSNDSLIILFNKYEYAKGENIIIDATIENFNKEKPTQYTLHVWVDNLKTKKRQKFRYPLLNGYLQFTLKIDNNLSEGDYAFNFLLDRRFFSVNGVVQKDVVNNRELNYVVTAKKKAPVIDNVSVSRDGSFSIQNFYFLDTVLFTFSPAIKAKENNLQIVISTPIDSVFTPTAQITEFIKVGNFSTTTQNSEERSNYNFQQYKSDKTTLQEVIVVARKKTEGEKFDEENSRGLFSSDATSMFDLLSSDEHLKFPDLFSYLVFKLPGLTKFNNPDNGQPFLRWRGETTEIYVDEVYLDGFSPNDISLQDIAIVKVYGQSFRIGGASLGDGLGGTIAIYTKNKNILNSNKLSNYTFSVKGYNNLISIWKD